MLYSKEVLNFNILCHKSAAQGSFFDDFDVCYGVLRMRDCFVKIANHYTIRIFNEFQFIKIFLQSYAIEMDVCVSCILSSLYRSTHKYRILFIPFLPVFFFNKLQGDLHFLHSRFFYTHIFDFHLYVFCL